MTTSRALLALCTAAVLAGCASAPEIRFVS